MFKYIVLLALGVAIGYFIGFADSKKHDDHIVKRIVTRIGGGRGAQGNDIDSRMEKVVGK
jgi:hypothetical protein